MQAPKSRIPSLRARVMNAAHGGHVLISQTVANLIRDRLPENVLLRDLDWRIRTGRPLV